MAEDRTPVIAGIGLSGYPKVPELSSRQHHVLAAQRALADSGLEMRDIDGYLTADQTVPDMAEYLQVKHRYIDGTMTGGSAYVFHVQHAAASIRQGLEVYMVEAAPGIAVPVWRPDR